MKSQSSEVKGRSKKKNKERPQGFIVCEGLLHLLSSLEKWAVPSWLHYLASSNGRKTAQSASVSHLSGQKKGEKRKMWVGMRGGCAPLTCCAQGSHTKINTFELMSQPFHVVSEGFSAWGERFWFLTTLFSWSVAAKTSRGNGQAQA